jgi:Lhr-like helicase
MTVTVKVNLMAGRKKIKRDLASVVGRLVPYRDLDKRIFQALMFYRAGNMSFAEASRRAFNTPKHGEKIRHWYNWFIEKIRMDL